jgi:iron complex transport system ATP-binding protein
MRLEAKGVAATLNGRPILDGIDLAVEGGEIVGVIGPNGAGKSTLLRVLAGLLAPCRGTVNLDGAPLAALAPHARGRAIAYLGQDRIVHWPMAVRRVVALGRLPHHAGRATGLNAADAHAIEQAIAAMDIAAFVDRPVSELSGGERARVLVARALAQQAPLLIADEPTAGLDPAHALGLFESFRAMATAGRSVIVALHDLSLAARYCSRLVLLRGGVSVASGPPSGVLTPPVLARAYGITATVATIGGVPIVVPHSPLP